MHISYFVNTHSVSFIKSLLKLPELNARGLTSKQSYKVPWGNQYRVNGVYSLYNRAEYNKDYEYEDYDYDDYEYEEQVVEHLSPRGWVYI